MQIPHPEELGKRNMKETSVYITTIARSVNPQALAMAVSEWASGVGEKQGGWGNYRLLGRSACLTK